MSVSSPSSSNAAGSAGELTSKQVMNQSFDQFINLLMAQLKNQNPMEPMKTNELTTQLIQYTSINEQIKQTELLSALLSKTDASNAIGTLSFVGRKVTASGTTTALENGTAEWAFDAPRAGTGKITITDSNGKIVYKTSIALSGGVQNFSWDGTTTDGLKADDGLYSVSIEGTTTGGMPFTVSSQITGTVDGVDLSQSPPTLKIGKLKIDLSSIRSIGNV